MEYYGHYTSKLHWTDEEEDHLVDLYHKLCSSAPTMAANAQDKFWNTIRVRMHYRFEYDDDVELKESDIYKDRIYALLTLNIKEKEEIVNEVLEDELPWDDEIEEDEDGDSDQSYYSEEDYY